MSAIAPETDSAVCRAEGAVASIRGALAAARPGELLPRVLTAVAQLRRLELSLLAGEALDDDHARLLEGVRFFRCELAEVAEGRYPLRALEGEGLAEIESALAALHEH